MCHARCGRARACWCSAGTIIGTVALGHYVVDGRDHLIQETSSHDPLHPIADPHFQPLAPFPPPLDFTRASTKGADLIWTPLR